MSEVRSLVHPDKCTDSIVDGFTRYVPMSRGTHSYSKDYREINHSRLYTICYIAQYILVQISSYFVLNNFSLILQWITEKFNLDKPFKETFLYMDITGYSQVVQSAYAWNQLDELDLFDKLLK